MHLRADVSRKMQILMEDTEGFDYLLFSYLPGYPFYYVYSY